MELPTPFTVAGIVSVRNSVNPKKANDSISSTSSPMIISLTGGYSKQDTQGMFFV